MQYIQNGYYTSLVVKKFIMIWKIKKEAEEIETMETKDLRAGWYYTLKSTIKEERDRVTLSSY